MTGMLFLLSAAALHGAGGKLPPYAESIRCAGLAEAATEAATDRAEERRLFDAAIFWGMAASEAARKAKYPGERFTADQLSAAAAAKTELVAPAPGARAELAACLDRVPRLRR